MVRTQADIPKICLPPNLQDKLLKLSIQMEKGQWTIFNRPKGQGRAKGKPQKVLVALPLRGGGGGGVKRRGTKKKNTFF